MSKIHLQVAYKALRNVLYLCILLYNAVIYLELKIHPLDSDKSKNLI